MNVTFNRKLKVLRKEIDSVDKALVRSLAKRMAVSKKMGTLKKKYGIPIVQKSRWNLVIKSRLQLARSLGLNAQIVDKIFRQIHKGSVEMQKRAKRSL